METVGRVVRSASSARSTTRNGKRQQSDHARTTADTFNRLREHFANMADFRKALRWSAPTMRQWLSEGPPTRPREASSERVAALLAVCDAARPWVADPHVVGTWLITSQPHLRDATPAQVVAELGWQGATQLTGVMEKIAPTERAPAEPVGLTADQLREALQALGAPQMPAHEPVDVDLSDFDD